MYPLSRLSILICNQHRDLQASCGARGAADLIPLLRSALNSAGLDIPIEVIECFGRCEQGPNLRIAPGHRFYEQVVPAVIPSIISELHRLSELDAE